MAVSQQTRAYLAQLLAAWWQVGEAGTESRVLAEPLSERELAVLRLMAGGHSVEEIANRLVISASGPGDRSVPGPRHPARRMSAAGARVEHLVGTPYAGAGVSVIHCSPQRWIASSTGARALPFAVSRYSMRTGVSG